MEMPETSESLRQQHHTDWTEAQELLKTRLVLQDDFSWRISVTGSTNRHEQEDEQLRYVGGMDLSFSKEDSSIACGALVVVDLLDGAKVVYEDYSVVRLEIPYIPGFLAFREVPVLLALLEKMKSDGQQFYPQLLMVDGNGLLHPRGFGLACHLGVLTNLPSIGIGKNLHHVDGLTQPGVRQILEAKENLSKDLITLAGLSGRTWGAAMRSTQDSLKPIYISIGHRVSLDTAIKVVKMTCKYRVPEPIRQADIRSKNFLQKHPTLVS